MGDTQTLENFEAAGRLMGMAYAYELRKLAMVKLMSDQIDRDFEGKSADAKAEAIVAAKEGLGKTIWKEVKPFGQTAISTVIGATLGHTLAQRNQSKDKKPDHQGPEMFRSGFEAGLHEGMTRASLQGIPKAEKK